MKTIYTLFVSLVILLSSCKNWKSKEQIVNEDFKFESYNIKGGWQYQVIEFENHKYISISDGGIVHAESCQCK